MTNILAIWYPTSYKRGTKQEIVQVPDINTIKETISELLFGKRANHLLLSYKDQLYVIESMDIEKKLYSKRVVEYHPLQEKLN